MNYKQLPIELMSVILDSAAINLDETINSLGFSVYSQFFLIEVYEVNKGEQIAGKFIVFITNDNNKYVVFESMYPNGKNLSGSIMFNDSWNDTKNINLELFRIIPIDNNACYQLVCEKTVISNLPAVIILKDRISRGKTILGYISKGHWHALSKQFKRHFNVSLPTESQDGI